jgi:hypothetical protein
MDAIVPVFEKRGPGMMASAAGAASTLTTHWPHWWLQEV